MAFVIIGGDAAGMSAAMQIVRNEPDANIITLEMGDIYSYAQCGLPYVVGGLIPSTDSLIARDVDTFRKKYGIDARTKHKVTHIDPEKKIVSGDDFEIAYNKLLIASGADPYVPSWDGTHLHRIHTVKTIPQIHALMDDLEEDVQHVTVIGGGYIGLEMIENLVRIDKKVTLIQRSSQVASMFDEDLAAIIHENARKKGVDVRLNENVQSFIGDNYVTAVQTDKETISTDLVIIATGVKPNTTFLKDTGIHLHKSGAIRVNRFMETNIDDIYAAGDCATQYNRIKQRDDYIPLGTHANKQGRLAGLAMIGKPRPFAGVVGTSILQFFDLTLARTGLSTKELIDQQYPFRTVTADLSNQAGYYPAAEKLTVRLAYHATTNKLLGGQIVGKKGVDKRIDVLATALYNDMTIDDLEHLDLAYAPPYNTVWDPIQQVARRRTYS